jgi:SAM-dependent methyltransferase
VAGLAGKLGDVTGPDREQRLVFGEIAPDYDVFRPSYPDAVFDTIVEFGELCAGDRALEIGAGTGKATLGFLARGLDVHALEPSPEMAAILRTKGVDVEETLFETWAPPDDGFQLVYAAQAWHWVHGDDRYERVAAALRPGGTAAFFWNEGREWTGTLGAENDAVYAELAPGLVGGADWNLDQVLDGFAACEAFATPVKRTVTWRCEYTRDEWTRLLGTHSHHRLLDPEVREDLTRRVGEVIDRHSGRVEAIYDVECYLSRRV